MKTESIYHPDGKGNKNTPPFEVDQEITIFIDPKKELAPIIFFEESSNTFNLKKEN